MQAATAAAAALLAAWFPPKAYPISGPLILALIIISLTKPLKPPPKLANLLIALATAILLTVESGDKETAIYHLVMLLGAWTLLRLGRSNPDADWLPVALGVGLAPLSLWALWQATAGMEAMAAQAESIPDLMMREQVVARLKTHRAFAGMGIPSHLAIVLVFALMLLLSSSAKRKLGRKRWLAMALPLAALSLLGIVATRSLLPVGILLVCALAAAPGKTLKIPVLLAAGTALAAVLATRSDLITRSGPLALRFSNWKTGLWIWSRHPFLGAGLGSYGVESSHVPFPLPSPTRFAHSLPVEAAAAGGIAGIILFAAFAIWLALLISAKWREDKALSLALAAVFLHNLADFSFFMPQVLYPWALLAGYVWGRVKKLQPQQEDRNSPNSRHLISVIAQTAPALVLLPLVTLHALSVMATPVLTPPLSYDQLTAAHRMAPWRSTPLIALSELYSQRERDMAQEALCNSLSSKLYTALRMRPRSCAVASALASALICSARPVEALGVMKRCSDAEFGNPKAYNFYKFLIKGLGKDKVGGDESTRNR